MNKAALEMGPSTGTPRSRVGGPASWGTGDHLHGQVTGRLLANHKANLTSWLHTPLTLREGQEGPPGARHRLGEGLGWDAPWRSQKAVSRPVFCPAPKATPLWEKKVLVDAFREVTVISCDFSPGAFNCCRNILLALDVLKRRTSHV